MIRTSWRKNAGSRRNKKHKTVKTHRGDFKGWKKQLGRRDPSYQSKPNHAARFANLADCFPLFKAREEA